MKLGKYLKEQQDKFSKAQPWYVVDHVFYAMTDLPDFFVYNGDEAINEMADQVLSAIERKFIKPDHLVIKFVKKDNGKKAIPYYYVMEHSNQHDITIKTHNIQMLIKIIRRSIAKSGEQKIIDQMIPNKVVYIGKNLVE